MRVMCIDLPQLGQADRVTVSPPTCRVNVCIAIMGISSRTPFSNGRLKFKHLFETRVGPKGGDFVISPEAGKSWIIAWATMIPFVLLAIPLIRRAVDALTRERD
jgi:hypothetical protein